MTTMIDRVNRALWGFAVLWALFVVLLSPFGAEKAPASSKGSGYQVRSDDRKIFELKADAIWQIELPNQRRFDASGLVIYQNKLLTISDRASDLWWLEPGTNGIARMKISGLFTSAQLREANDGRDSSHDCEGIGLDPAGNLYICEEKDRAIYRWDAEKKKVSRLKIDWAPVQKYFSRLDDNASFEGITIGGGKLWVANERSEPRIIRVGLESLQVEDSFFVDASSFAFGGPHYTDLSWFEDHLFILDRNHRCILEVDPTTKKVLAEYSFANMELEPDVAYNTIYPTGAMEGLAIEKDYFWLVTDNNGRPRFKHPQDMRPSLFRCKRPR